MKALTSRTVWTLIFQFVTNGFLAISGNFDPATVLIVNAVFSAVATYFKLNPSQRY